MGAAPVRRGPPGGRCGARDRVALRRLAAGRGAAGGRRPPELDVLLPAWESVPLARMPAAVAALLEGRPVDIEDAQDDERIPAELAADLGMSSVRFEPLIVGKPVGMLTLEPAPQGANPELHSLLATVAASVARLASTLEGDRERVEVAFLLDLTESAVKAPSLESMLATVCERTAKQLGAKRATILLREDGRLAPRASRYSDGARDIGEWEAMRRTPNPLPAAQAALDSGEPVMAREAGSPLIGNWGASAFEVRSLLAVPLSDFGVLVLDDSEPGTFAPENVQLAAAAAAHVAPAIEQARDSDERTSHLRAATAVRRLLEEGARATSVRRRARCSPGSRVRRSVRARDGAAAVGGRPDRVRLDGRRGRRLSGQAAGAIGRHAGRRLPAVANRRAPAKADLRGERARQPPAAAGPRR